MDVHHDELALERLLFQQVDHLLSVGRRQSRRGFVEEEHGWLANQLQRDVQPLSLSSGDVFVDGRAHFQVFRSVEFEVLQRFEHATVDFLLVHAFETEFRRVVEVLIYGEFLDEQVVLWHESDEGLCLGFRNVVAIDGDAAFLRLQRAVQQREERGFSRTRAAHDGEEIAVAEREVQVVHAVVAVGEAEVDVSSAKFHALRLVLVGSRFPLMGLENGGIIDGFPVFPFQHAALQQHLIRAWQHGNVVEQHRVGAVVGEHDGARFGMVERFQRAVESLEMVHDDVFGGVVADVVDEIAE